MRTVEIPGISSPGPGDIVAGLSSIISKQREDTHFVIYVKRGFGLPRIMSDIIEEFDPPHGLKITYEVIEGNHDDPNDLPCKHSKEAFSKYKKKDFEETWDLIRYKHNSLGYGKYLDFKRQWKKNIDGPILLSLNTEDREFVETHPFPQKWLDWTTNDLLKSYVDDKNVYQITGELRSFQDNLKLMEECKFILGIDCRWAHIANCMNVPYVMMMANWSYEDVKDMYKSHPTLRIVPDSRAIDYLTKNTLVRNKRVRLDKK
jgi:hypothetical protein